MSTQYVVVSGQKEHLKERVATSIRQHRESLGWSKRELGRRAGIGDRNIGYWEKGRGEPDITAFIKLAQAIGISLDELAGIKRQGKES